LEQVCYSVKFVGITYSTFSNVENDGLTIVAYSTSIYYYSTSIIGPVLWYIIQYPKDLQLDGMTLVSVLEYLRVWIILTLLYCILVLVPKAIFRAVMGSST
jgi:hypothetical protein